MRNRLPVLRVPRSIHLIMAICILVIVLTTGAVYLPRLAPDSYHCLRYDMLNGTDFIPNVVDIRTGRSMIDQRFEFARHKLSFRSISPNGKYEARIITPLQGKPRLYLEKPDGATYILETDATNVIDKPAWYPNSEWIVYIVQAASYIQLIIVRSDGSEKRTVTLVKPNGKLLIKSLGVSNDATYYTFFTDDGKQRAYHFLRLTDLTEQQVILTDTSNFDYIESVAWSPQGHWLAVIDSQRGVLEILSPERNVIQPSEFFSGIGLAPLQWSPDGKYLATMYATSDKGALLVYEQDGQRLLTISQWGDFEVEPFVLTLNWRRDSQSVVFLEPAAGTFRSYNLKQFYPGKQQVETILHEASFVGEDHQTIDGLYAALFSSYRADKQDAYFVRFEKNIVSPVVKEASSIISSDWSPSFNNIAVEWEIGEGARVQHRITIFSSKYYIVSRTFDVVGKLEKLVWGLNDEWIAYTMQSDSGTLILEVANIITGQKRRLVDNLVITSFSVDYDTNRLWVEWQDKSGKQHGIDVYESDGTRKIRVPIVRTDTSFEYFNYSISPDTQSIVMEFWNRTGLTRFEIARTDGAWHKELHNGFVGGIDFYGMHWSPDSKYLAFIQGRRSLKIITATGELLWQSNSNGPEFTHLKWTPCY